MRADENWFVAGGRKGWWTAGCEAPFDRGESRRRLLILLANDIDDIDPKQKPVARRISGGLANRKRRGPKGAPFRTV